MQELDIKTPQMYQKLPVRAEAIYYDGENLDALKEFCGEHLIIGAAYLYIRTLEGKMQVSFPEGSGVYVIRGLAGEFYPCEKEIFLQSYALIEYM